MWLTDTDQIKLFRPPVETNGVVPVPWLHVHLGLSWLRIRYECPGFPGPLEDLEGPA